jgi:hypothetical protein
MSYLLKVYIWYNSSNDNYSKIPQNTASQLEASLSHTINFCPMPNSIELDRAGIEIQI